MLDRVRDQIKRHAMLAPGSTVIVAVSGGPDSTALLHILWRLAPEFDVNLHVFHLDHALRGEASAQDAVFVQGLAERLHVPCTVAALAPLVLEHQQGSLQANARSIRYKKIRALAQRIGADRAALGHNRDDQAETVVMRFLRGAGSRGLSGIPPVRQDGGLTFLRPLLEIPRAEIECYCRQNELLPRLDESNLKDDYLRNRIRLRLLPQLKRDFNPGITDSLVQMADVLREEDALLDHLARKALQRCRRPGPDVVLSGQKLLQEHRALARRVIRLAVQEVAGSDFQLGLEPVTQVLDSMADSRGTRELCLPGGIRAVLEYGTCSFVGPGENDTDDSAVWWPLPPQGVVELPELGMSVEITEGGIPSGPSEAAFDRGLLPGPLAIRFRQPGDRIWPVGIGGSKKLQDLLVDLKVPRRVRDRVPLLVSGNEVIWVIGYRLDRRFLATSTSENVIRVRIRYMDSPAEK